jgi:hypothetical protein
MNREWKERYEAVDLDDQNKKYTINVYMHFKVSSLLNGTTQKIYLSEVHTISNGNHVNLQADGTLLDIITQRRMRRI